MPVERTHVTWLVMKKAGALLEGIRKEYPSAQAYEDDRHALQEWLCHYFSTGTCLEKSGTISPMGGVPDGGKVLKVRWTRPGRGKSGALRLILVAYCGKLTVKLACAYVRENDPSKDEITDDVKDALS